jgi:rubredoxin
MPCPECLNGEVVVHEYDFGICPQTGYHDAGERFWCRACGATGDADDLVPIETAGNSISAGPRNGRAAAGKAMARCTQPQHGISS